MRESSIALPTVGSGPPNSTAAVTKRWRNKMGTLRAGDIVDILLDDGRIVRSTLRQGISNDIRPHMRCVCWVRGIQGSYALGRVRPVNGWWRTVGCVRAVTTRVELNPSCDLPLQVQFILWAIRSPLLIDATFVKRSLELA